MIAVANPWPKLHSCGQTSRGAKKVQLFTTMCSLHCITLHCIDLDRGKKVQLFTTMCLTKLGPAFLHNVNIFQPQPQPMMHKTLDIVHSYSCGQTWGEAKRFAPPIVQHHVPPQIGPCPSNQSPHDLLYIKVYWTH